jgi:hypothetical protein
VARHFNLRDDVNKPLDGMRDYISYLVLGWQKNIKKQNKKESQTTQLPSTIFTTNKNEITDNK